jgi:hypothetical protein
MFVYSIFDKTAKQFGLPFFQITDETALRLFGNLVNDKDSMLNKNPDDYTLFQVGEFDEQTGDILSPAIGPVVIKNALEVQQEPQQAAA